MQSRFARLGIAVKVETFNSFCEKILLRNTGKIYGRRMSVASFSDKMLALSFALTSLGLTIETVIERYYAILDDYKKKQAAILNKKFKKDAANGRKLRKA